MRPLGRPMSCGGNAAAAPYGFIQYDHLIKNVLFG